MLTEREPCLSASTHSLRSWRDKRAECCMGQTTGSPHKLGDRIFKFRGNVREYRKGSLTVTYCDEYLHIRSK